MFLLAPLMEDAVPTVTRHGTGFILKGKKSRVREFLMEGYFLFENKTYGKSISSGKSLARLPVKTFPRIITSF